MNVFKALVFDILGVLFIILIHRYVVTNKKPHNTVVDGNDACLSCHKPNYNINKYKWQSNVNAL